MKEPFSGLVAVVVLMVSVGCGGDDRPVTGSDGGGSDAATADASTMDGSAVDAFRPDAGPPGGDPETLARAGVVLGSCWPDDGVGRNLDYLWNADLIPRLWGRTVLQAECLAATTAGCDALEECFGMTLEPTTEACPFTCDGDVFSGCSDGGRWTIDCSTIGWVCDTEAICAPAPTSACDSSTFVESCDAEGRPLFCDDGAEWRGVKCADHDLVCAEGLCTGTGETCVGDTDHQGRVIFDGEACDGSRLQACVGGRMHDRDCAALGLGCQQVAGDGLSVYICGIDSECAPASSATCADATTISVCNAGRLDTVDCTSLGFSGCEDTSRGAVCR